MRYAILIPSHDIRDDCFRRWQMAMLLVAKARILHA